MMAMQLLTETTSANAGSVLRKTIGRRFGTLATTVRQWCVCFVGQNGYRKAPTGS